MQQRRRGPARHARITVRGAGHDALEQAKHGAHAGRSSSARTSAISEVPGFANIVSTPPRCSVSSIACAPFTGSHLIMRKRIRRRVCQKARVMSASAELIRHPAAACDAVRRIAVEASRAADALDISFRVEGDVSQLAIPAAGTPQRADGLWQHSCFEAFLQAGGGEAYFEFNFSPSGAWAAYRFSARRRGRESPVLTAPRTEVRRGPDWLTMNVRLSPAAIAEFAGLADRGRARGRHRGPAWRPLLVGARASRGGPRFPRSRDIHAAAARMMKFGIDRLLADRALRKPLAGRRVALLAHPASVTARPRALARRARRARRLKLTAAFGPQHGLRGDKQDNMVESPDFTDPVHGIPVFSLYGEVRRPTAAMMDTFDVLLVDLQDVGCRIYTFITTLRYVLEAAAQHGKAVWVLDRPNPAGRPVEGLRCAPGWESFVGAGPAADAPRPHARRAGALVRRDAAPRRRLPRSSTMEGWQPRRAARLRLAARRAQLGQPEPERAEPLDGALLSRHGDARGHDAVRRPRHDAAARALRRAGPRRAGAARDDARARARSGCAAAAARPAGSSRPSTSTPASSARACRSTSTIRATTTTAFRPWRLHGARLQGAARSSRPDYPLWRDFPYEYETRPARDRRHQRRRRCCASGSTIPARRPPISTPSPADEAAWRESAPALPALSLSATRKNPPTFPSGGFGLDPGSDLLSHGLRPHYHRRRASSLPSSEWDRVVPARHDRQENCSPAPRIATAAQACSKCGTRICVASTEPPGSLGVIWSSLTGN